MTPVSKTPFLDLLAPAYGLAGASFPEKIEGIAFGPDLADGSHLLLVTHDNDFVADSPSRIFAFSIAPPALPAFKAQSASFSDACVSPAPVTCATTEPCRRDGMCNPGTAACVPPALPAGTTAGNQTPGDCQKSQCNGDGSLVSINDDGDVPADDGNQCTGEVCLAGAPTHPARPAGTMCTQSGGSVCDGAGSCVACVLATDCPGTDTDCSRRACISGACNTLFTPSGVPTSVQTLGDCLSNQCDGAGNVVSVTDDNDIPADTNVCTFDLCTAGVPSNPASPAGTTCGSSQVCDGAGSCIGCITSQDCPGSDTECGVRTCNAGVCGVTFAPVNTFVSTQIEGDCVANVCDGVGNVVVVNDDRDVKRDGNACTNDVCTAGVSSFPNAPVGTPCEQTGGTECDGAGVCVVTFMAVRMGSPGGTNLSSAASPVFVDQIDLSGRLLRAIALPTVTSGAQRRFVNSGQAGSEGSLALSLDGRYVTLGGYDAAPGTTGIASTASATVPRVVARIDAAGTVDTSTSINNSFTGNNIRGAVTSNGFEFWAAGAGGGVQLVNLGQSTSTTISSNLANVRTLQIINGQLFGSAASGNFNNVFTVGAGVPTTPANVVALPGFAATGPSPYAFVFIGQSLLYVADDRTVATGGGIQKWLFNGATWTLVKTFTGGLGTFGVRGLAGYATDSSVVLIATTAESANPSGQRIVTLVDDGLTEPTATTIVNGSAQVAYRGVALPPH